ncbi:unnamed protein product [Polarella glacialis]|uniref:Uncharacterized protein n=1 Tax=Polarella glacialis TaxID=89957 RepID=A0A813GS60_POLGL|nr:unnamed protein product [Polarella glacialis]
MARQSRGIRRRPALAAISIGGLFWASHVAFLPSPAQPVRGGVAATMGLFASVAGQLSARAQGAEGGDGGLQVEFSTLEEAQAAAAALRAKSGDFTGLLLDQPVNLVEPDLPKPDSAAEFTVKVFTEVFESGNIGAIPQAIGYVLNLIALRTFIRSYIRRYTLRRRLSLGAGHYSNDHELTAKSR